MAQPAAPVPASSGRPAHHKKAIALAVAAAVGGFLFGFDSSVINGAVDAMGEAFGIGSALQGFAVAVALLGCAFGAWLGGKLADRYGRTRVMVIGSILFFVSSILTGIAFGVWDFILWRILAGIGIGIASVIAPTYIAEIAPASIRGRLASLQQLAITLGIFAALLSDQLLQAIAGGASEELWLGLEAWRWMFIVAVVPAVVYGVLALTIPESPRYLVAVGKHDEAYQVLEEVLDPEEHPQTRIDEIEKNIAEDKAAAGTASLRGGRFGFLPVVWLGILLSVFQQFVGINVIFYYSTTLWQAVGFDESDSFTFSTITSVTNVLVTFIAIALVDKRGRRPLLLTGSIGMAITLGIMAVAFTQAIYTDVPDPENAGATITETSLPGSWGVIALVAANLFVVFFGATWGPVVWVLLGEMFPNRIRAAALGVAAAAQWIANFLITVSFPPLLDRFGASIPYLIYAIFAFLSFIFVLTKIPETKGVELEDMQHVKVERRART